MNCQTIYIHCQKCGRELIELPMNSEYDQLEEICCLNCGEEEEK